MINLKHYLHHLSKVTLMSYESVAIYRFDFSFRIIRPILEIIVTLTLLNALFSHSATLGTWTITETALVTAISLLTVGLVTLFFGNGLEGLHREIVTGTFDRLLLQPMDAQWLASTRIVFVTNIFRVAFNVVFFYFIVIRLNQAPSLGDWLLFGLAFISALVIYYSLMFSASIVSFWALSGELFYLFNSVTSVAKYPIDIFGSLLRFFLTFLPVIFLATVPAQALLGKPTLLVYLSPFIACLALWLTRRFWHVGLRSYESASS